MMTTEKTLVLFRKFAGGEIIALFPNEPGTTNPHDCSSYQHIGQHGTAHYNFVATHTRPAKPKEYSDLYVELTHDPFNYDLQVIKHYRRINRLY